MCPEAKYSEPEIKGAEDLWERVKGRKISELKEDEIEGIFRHNRRVFMHNLLGKSPAEETIDVCWFCGRIFRVSEAEYCERCDTWRCPFCSKCLCDMRPEARQALDRELFSLGIWENPWHNLPRRKKRKKAFEMTRAEFLRYVEKAHPDLYEAYRTGRIDFLTLHGEVMSRIDRTIHITG